jgi:tRNA1Val (adenine37-N6)-methyltransferase
LVKSGQLSVVLPITEGLQFVRLAQKVNLFLCRKCEVYTRRNNSPERLLLTFSQEDHGHLITEKLIIHEGESNAYSADYIALTKDFYLNM